MEIDAMTFFFLATMAIVIFGGTISYFNDVAINEAKSEIFSSITNTTTNMEIVEHIHDTCSRRSTWYFWKVDCEKALLKTFIIPTRVDN